jgi:hypothetical protein
MNSMGDKGSPCRTPLAWLKLGLTLRIFSKQGQHISYGFSCLGTKKKITAVRCGGKVHDNVKIVTECLFLDRTSRKTKEIITENSHHCALVCIRSRIGCDDLLVYIVNP